MIERYDDNDDFSERLFSYHRYLAIRKFCHEKVVIDMACGTGYGSEILSEVADKVIGLDIDADTIKRCQQKYNNDNLSFIVSSVSDIGVKSHSVDVFVSCETIEHVDASEQKRFISEIKRTLRDDGVAVITTPNKQRTDHFEIKNQFHIKELYPMELINLVKARFSFYKIYYMDINMTSCIFEQDEDAINKLDMLKMLNNSSDNDMSHEPIYTMIVCSNKETSMQSMASVLYDFEYKFTDYIWGQLNLRKKQDKEMEIKDAKIRESDNKIIELKAEVERLNHKHRSIINRVYQKMTRRDK